MRRFNVTGLCIPEEDYMVDISGKIEQIRKLVDERRYFTINRARQYGKTTTLAQLENALKNDYIVVSITFEAIEDECFSSAASFCSMFAGLVGKALKTSGVSEPIKEYWPEKDEAEFRKLGGNITELCRNRKIVLMIDEVDKSSNNRLFLHFLGLLRGKFLARKAGKDYTFHSVILAGVHDVKNLKLKMINEGTYTPAAEEGKLLNSPWNIAVSFNVDMSFNPGEIATMLVEYEKDHQTGMDIAAVAEEIHNYTSGYPFLVSRICQCIDEELVKDWTHNGIQSAVKVILGEKNTLFDDIYKNVESNDELYDFLYGLLLVGEERSFNYFNPVIDLGFTYGFIKKGEYGRAVVSNRIFESFLYEYFISKDSTSKKRITGVLKQDVIFNERFDMELCLRKFAEHYAQIYNEIDEKFIEREGRLLFLSFLKPLINGVGFFHVESELTDRRRIDITVDYMHEQFIVELKLWKGEARHEEAYKQLARYLESKNADTGYLLTFDFRKDENKEPRAEWVEHEMPGGRSKRLFDVVV